MKVRTELIARAVELADDDEDSATTDPSLVPDIAASDVEEPEFKDGLVRITLTMDRRAPFSRRERVVVVRVVMSEERFYAAFRKVADAVAHRHPTAGH